MVNNIDFNLIDRKLALEIDANLLGRPTINRVVLAVNSSDRRSEGGIILPDNAKEEIPKKGVIVKMGPTDGEDSICELVKVGDIVSYGIYGGKEVYPNFLPNFNKEAVNNLKFYVLSASEIIYIEPNLK